MNLCSSLTSVLSYNCGVVTSCEANASDCTLYRKYKIFVYFKFLGCVSSLLHLIYCLPQMLNYFRCYYLIQS